MRGESAHRTWYGYGWRFFPQSPLRNRRRYPGTSPLRDLYDRFWHLAGIRNSSGRLDGGQGHDQRIERDHRQALSDRRSHFDLYRIDSSESSDLDSLPPFVDRVYPNADP